MIGWVVFIALISVLILVLAVRGWLGLRGSPSVRYPSIAAASVGACIPGSLGYLSLCAMAVSSGTTKFILLWVAAVLFVTCSVYLVAYQQFGAPDWLRPRPQRGLAKGEYTVAKLFKYGERRQAAREAERR